LYCKILFVFGIIFRALTRWPLSKIFFSLSCND
jgi:hypothetical protein